MQRNIRLDRETVTPVLNFTSLFPLSSVIQLMGMEVDMRTSGVRLWGTDFHHGNILYLTISDQHNLTFLHHTPDLILR